MDNGEKDMLSRVTIADAVVEIPVMTVAAARAWMEYMRGVGEGGDADVIGSAVLEHLTLTELYYLLPDIADGALEALPLPELAAVEAAFCGRNPEFVSMRRRVVRAGEQYLRAAVTGGGGPAGAPAAPPGAEPG